MCPAEAEVTDSQLPTLPKGIFAALPTPCREDGTPYIECLDPLVDSLAGTGLTGICIGGATGEYLAYSLDERARMLDHLATRTRSRMPIIFGVGGESYRQVSWLIQTASGSGASSLLLPAPAYFRYDSNDLTEMVSCAAAASRLPVLLYLIPQFNGEISIEDALGLIKTAPNIAGVKDSSGHRASLLSLAEAKRRIPFSWFSGSDDVLLDALIHGADGAISGVASACPELVLGIYRTHEQGQMDEARQLQMYLNEFIIAIGEFPVPWGIRWAIEARGFSIGPPIWPVSARREAQAKAFQNWFASWWPRCNELCSQVLSHG